MKLNVLQVGRALAALAVVAHHAGSHGTAHTERLSGILAAITETSYVGVDFFFVLSGFIIFHTTVGRVSDAVSLRRYVRQRATRIYLPYWPIGLGLACAYVLLPSLRGSTSSWSWMESASLLPFWDGPALNVAWTLQHELTFYVIFGLGLLLGRPLAVLGAWMGAVAVALFVLPIPSTISVTWQHVLFAPINLEFGMGVAAACWYRSGRRARPVTYALGVLGPLALWATLGLPRELSFIVGLAFAVAVAWVTTMERSKRISSPRWLIFLGDASYSLYLIHYPLLSLTSRLADDAWQAFALGMAVSVIAGIVYHLTVERWMLRSSQKMDRRSMHGLPAT